MRRFRRAGMKFAPGFREAFHDRKNTERSGSPSHVFGVGFQSLQGSAGFWPDSTWPSRRFAISGQLLW